MEPSIRVDGLRELRRDLKRLGPEVDKGLKDALKDAAEKVAVTAGAMAPRRSGDLQHSIRAQVTGANASVRSSLPYANVVHWGGTIRPRGVPIVFRRTEFITRAVRDHEPEIVHDVSNAIDTAARRMGWHVG